ncbi:hypothetical protein SAMN05444724_2471 [Salinivibrio sp. ES.052]|nr:hypothetical protein SAMN05444724_2471 [Salinivibrio sp. ES.052]
MYLSLVYNINTVPDDKITSLRDCKEFINQVIHKSFFVDKSVQ